MDLFELFDPNEDFEVTAANLPHWFQTDVTYFLTFRTADSIPRGVAELWNRRRREWLMQHRIDPDHPDWSRQLSALPKQQRGDYYNQFSAEYLSHLDRGYGACPLKKSDLAEEVSKALLSFNHDRYELAAFVVMPNHVHVLLAMRQNITPKKQCTNWKHYTARIINAKLQRAGAFWQTESYDHLVRSPQSFERIQQYIVDNPGHAGLKAGEYIVYLRPQGNLL